MDVCVRYPTYNSGNGSSSFHYHERDQTVISFKPKFGYIGSNRRKARWPDNGKGLLIRVMSRVLQVND